MNIPDWLNDPVITAIIGIFAPMLFAFFPGLGALLKIFPRSFWEAAGKAVGFTVTWVSPAQTTNLQAELDALRTNPDWHDPNTSVGKSYAEKSAQLAAAAPAASGLTLPPFIQQNLPLILIGVVLFFFMKGGGGCTPTPKTATTKTSVAVDPAADLKAAAAPLAAIAAKNPTAAAQVGRLYEALADVIRRDAGLQRLTTTGQVRSYLNDADTLRIQGTDLKDSLPGFDAVRSQVFTTAVGLTDQAVTPAVRERLAQAADAIGLALGA